MNTVLAAGREQVMDKKTVSISSKRQITIPQKYFTKLGFGAEAECVVRGDELIIRPVRNNVSGGEFAEQILANLVQEGLTGSDLLAAFKKAQAQVRPAVETMIAEAEKVAEGSAEYASYEDVFNTED